jgi:hypothetical protein
MCGRVLCAGKVTEKVGEMFEETGSVGKQFTPHGAAGQGEVPPGGRSVARCLPGWSGLLHMVAGSSYGTVVLPLKHACIGTRMCWLPVWACIVVLRVHTWAAPALKVAQRPGCLHQE